MNVKKKFLDIKNFLEAHSYLIDVEILKRYPDDINSRYLSFANELADYSLKDLSDFESHLVLKDKSSDSLKAFIESIKTLNFVPQLKLDETAFSKNLKRKLSPKKLHELQTLKTYFDNNDEVETLVDIGGGIGHLSNVFVFGRQRKALSIDLSKKFQQTGFEKIKRWLPDNLGKVEFINKELNSSLFGLDLACRDQTIIAGLHSCGPLSNHVIDTFLEGDFGHLLSFGCCYHKIQNEYNISDFSRDKQIELSNNALHLATRSYAITNEKSVLERRRVKFYRYALHHFCMQKLQRSFFSIGNGSQADYLGRFCDYAKKFVPELSSFSDSELEGFYESESIQRLIKENFLLDFIRGTLGRLVELYIGLDRVLYIEERGRKAQVLEMFDRKLSPRNLCILAN